MGEDDSGKTSLIKIITGEMRSSLGTVKLNGIDLKDHRRPYLARIAYCPEFNAIHDHLTGFQMMQLMGRLRGIPYNSLDIHTRQWLQLMGIIPNVWNLHDSSIWLTLELN